MHYMIPVIALKCFHLVTHNSAVSFSIKARFHESNNIFYIKNLAKLHKSANRFWQNIRNKVDVTLNVGANLAYVRSFMQKRLFDQTKFCMKMRLCNTFKTRKLKTMAKTISQSRHKVLQDRIKTAFLVPLNQFSNCLKR